MKTWSLANGYTKKSVIEKIKKEFKGKAMYSLNINAETHAFLTCKNDQCAYKTLDGKRCAIGLFLPEEHAALDFTGDVLMLLDKFPDLRVLMPFEESALLRFQGIHDSLSELLSVEEQTNILVKWVDSLILE